MAYIRSKEWPSLIESLSLSLKAVFLHSGTTYPSMLIAQATLVKVKGKDIPVTGHGGP
jgi:hypothetical protein